MNEREKTSLKFFSPPPRRYKKKSAKDRSLSSARWARPAQTKGFKILFCLQRLTFKRLSDLLLSSSPEHKRREIQKRKRERKENKKDKTGIRNTSRPTALAAPNTPRAPSSFDACCATTSSSPRTLCTSSSFLSLFFFLFLSVNATRRRNKRARFCFLRVREALARIFWSQKKKKRDRTEHRARINLIWPARDWAKKSALFSTDVEDTRGLKNRGKNRKKKNIFLCAVCFSFWVSPSYKHTAST